MNFAKELITQVKLRNEKLYEKHCTYCLTK